MKKSILDIELMNKPVVGECQTEDCADGGWFDDRIESLIIIHTRSLSESAMDPTSLISLQRTIGIQLMFEDPFSSDHISHLN